jgi:flagellar hook-length control protein FliK
MKLTQQKDKIELTPVIAGDLESVTAWEPRAGATSATGSLAQTLARTETPAAIGRQMAEALQKLADRPVEVSLNPRELGRVRMSIAAAEAGITVSVVVERPETLDLMRRNIDQLAREFQSIGYENINFSFAQGQSGEQRQTETGFDDRAVSTSIELEHVETTVAVPQPKDIINIGLDLRL